MSSLVIKWVSWFKIDEGMDNFKSGGQANKELCAELLCAYCFSDLWLSFPLWMELVSPIVLQWNLPGTHSRKNPVNKGLFLEWEKLVSFIRELTSSMASLFATDHLGGSFHSNSVLLPFSGEMEVAFVTWTKLVRKTESICIQHTAQKHALRNSAIIVRYVMAAVFILFTFII